MSHAGPSGSSDSRPCSSARMLSTRGVHWHLLGCGLLFGLINATANYGLFLGAVHTSKLVGNSWGWLIASFLAAWGGTSWMSATTRSVAVLLPATVFYYLLDTVFANHVVGVGSSKSIAIMIFWVIAAVAVSATIGGLTRVIRRRTWVSVPAAAALPAYVAYAAFDVHQFLSREPWTDPVLMHVTAVLWPVAAGVALAAAVARAAIIATADANT